MMATLKMLICASLLVLTGACRKEKLPSDAQFKFLNDVVILRVPESEGHSLYRCVTTVQHELESLKPSFDYTDSRSEYSKVNEVATETWLPVSPNMFRILKLCKEYYKQTDGALDVTITPISQIWGFEGGAVPDSVPEEVVDAARMVIGVDRVELAFNSVRIDNQVITINLSPVLEGYLTDLCLKNLRNAEVPDLYIQIGNSARALGMEGPGAYWRAPIRNPFKPAEQLGSVLMKDKVAFSVSCTRDRYNEIEGRQVGHIIDPATGYPVKDTIQTVVIGPTATTCDALATAITVAGSKGAPKILAAYPRYKCAIIPNQEPIRCWISEGMADYLEWDLPAERVDVLPGYVPESEPDAPERVLEFNQTGDEPTRLLER